MRELTKWPRLLVAGQPVTETQANEILVRTDDWHLTGNDRPWIAALAALAGIEVGEHGWTTSASVQASRKANGVLDLHHLSNSRIISSWVGGPKGWCNWDGTVGCTTYNIGKWPGHEEVLSDWQKTARAFPFLDLTAQLVADEGEDDAPAVGYRCDVRQLRRQPVDGRLAGREDRRLFGRRTWADVRGDHRCLTSAP